MLRLVADTNTVVSALLWHGAPHRLFEAIETEELEFYASRALVDELADVLRRRKLAHAVRASGKSVLALAVIACALAARADFIVSGDDDLLVLKAYRRTHIVNAAEALTIIASR